MLARGCASPLHAASSAWRASSGYLGDWERGTVRRFRPDGTEMPALGDGLRKPSGIVLDRNRVLVVARAEADYLLPIYEGAIDIDCEIWVGKIGGASFEMFYELKSPAGLHARLKTVQVTVDIETKKSRRLRDEEREHLLTYQEEAAEA
jgi:hypothetical protein